MSSEKWSTYSSSWSSPPLSVPRTGHWPTLLWFYCGPSHTLNCMLYLPTIVQRFRNKECKTTPISLLLLVRWFPSRTMWQVWPCGLLRPVECGQTRVSQLEAWPCVPLPHQFCSAVLWKNHVPGSLLVQEAWWMQGTDLEACWSLESSPNTPDLS